MRAHGDRREFSNEDLVLKVTRNVDQRVWDETRYESYLDELCGAREYQKDAIRTVLRYLLGGRYENLRALAEENFRSNPELERRYGSWASMEKHLQLPDKLSCSVDQATGTGKSFVLYALAAILLAENAVDRVLVLCPSNTIEAGLLEKFRELAARSSLRDLLPSGVHVQTPRVINASESIVDGSICVENYHAILENVKSSVRDSLAGRGERVAVLNDEAHHVANETGTASKRWKEFLLDPDYGFRMVVGVSGTCYVGDEYFADVVSRYSLRQAIEERYVKQVEYIAEMPETHNPAEKWQLIYNRHQEWVRRLRPRAIRPLTIVVTKDIRSCKQVAEELQDFLSEHEGITAEQAQAKVLPVTSAKEHQTNLAQLRQVDNPSSKVEWITSVAMLSEGWDVKNVFQIVPHEERAFNSKLLIAQVLGRGLRRPGGWQGEDPVVSVFNHDAWSGRIKHLVNEILEIERRLTSTISPTSPFNFELHNLDYTRIEDTSQYTKKGEYRLLEQGYVDLPTQVVSEDVTVEYERAVTGERMKFRTGIQHKTWSVDEIAEQMFQRLRSIDEESEQAADPEDRTRYTQKLPLEKCSAIILESLKRARIEDGRITEENRQRILQALGPLRRKVAKRVIYRLSPQAIVTLNTSHRQAESCSAAELRRGSKAVFFTTGCESTLDDQQKEFFREVCDPDGEFAGSRIYVENSSIFKTPANIVIADGMPERRFVRELIGAHNAREIDAWLKNTPIGFYALEYAWKKGTTPKRGDFSPDFFIRQGDWVYVTEIKGDEEISDPSPENVKKHEYAVEHFTRLNAWLQSLEISTRYQFNMLTPKDFGKYFAKLRGHDLEGFRSELDVRLVQPE